MSKISIIKKIQLGQKSFPLEHPDAEFRFSFYCGNGGKKHEAAISFKTSTLLSSLIETGQITDDDLVQNNVIKLEYLKDQSNALLNRYQISRFKDCDNYYIIIFDINEYRDYYSCFIHGVLQIEF